MATTEPLKNWAYNIAIGFDQLFNTFLKGAPDETLSSRAYRGAMLASHPKRRWKVIYLLIETLFFWENAHCKTAFESEISRKQYPKEFKEWLNEQNQTHSGR